MLKCSDSMGISVGTNMIPMKHGTKEFLCCDALTSIHTISKYIAVKNWEKYRKI